MKKISVIIVTLLMMISLVACNGNKLYAEIKVKNIEHDKTAITFDIEIEDPDEQLEGKLNLFLFLEGKEVKAKRISRDSEEGELKNIEFNGLEAETRYDLEIEGTFDGKPKTLYKRNIATQSLEVKEITTVEDFFNISTRYSEYKLMNDLDFTDVDTSNKKVTTFRSEFDGNGHTIKNYDFTYNTTYSGLFGTLSRKAKVKNLTIDNFNISLTNDLTSNRTAGILFGRASSDEVEVSDITIKNSSITYNINSSSNSAYNYIGLLGGDARGIFTNINIDNTNTIDITTNKYSKTYIGGLFGNTHENVKVNEALVDGTINVNVEQDGENIKIDRKGKDAENNRHNLIVGGLIGNNNSNFIASAIVSTNINLVETALFATNGVKLTNYETYVGGVYGRSLYAVESVIYDGSIDVTTGSLTIKDLNDDEENASDTYETKVRRTYNVGGIAGNYIGYFSEFKHVVRANSAITVTTGTHDSIYSNVSTIFGNRKNLTDSEFNALESFKTLGSITDTENGSEITSGVAVITDITQYFENEWIINTYN